MDQKKLLTNIKKEIERNHISIKEIHLFGSRARGTAHKESDYDLAIISPSFKRLSPLQRHMKVIKPVRNIIGYQPLDLLCYTPEEFNNPRQGFLTKIIKKEGISI